MLDITISTPNLTESNKSAKETKKDRKRKNNLCDGAYVDATQAKTVKTLIYNK